MYFHNKLVWRYKCCTHLLQTQSKLRKLDQHGSHSDSFSEMREWIAKKQYLCKIICCTLHLLQLLHPTRAAAAGKEGLLLTHLLQHTPITLAAAGSWQSCTQVPAVLSSLLHLPPPLQQLTQFSLRQRVGKVGNRSTLLSPLSTVTTMASQQWLWYQQQ